MSKNKKNSSSSSLGRAVIKERFKGHRTDKSSDGVALQHSSDLDDGFLHTKITDSITEQNNLDDFLATAELAGREFTAEKMNVAMLASFDNEALLTEEHKKRLMDAHEQNRHLLRIPRRPHWTREMTPEQLAVNERDSFLEWRRGLAKLQEEEGYLMTPFERNLELWRQLWRVIERSDVVVQIVDARNPLLFRCPDLEAYVAEVDPRKASVLLLNKADLLTPAQRKEWADYFTEMGVAFIFFSAAKERERLIPFLEQEEEHEDLFPYEREALAARDRQRAAFSALQDLVEEGEEEETEDADANAVASPPARASPVKEASQPAPPAETGAAQTVPDAATSESAAAAGPAEPEGASSASAPAADGAAADGAADGAAAVGERDPTALMLCDELLAHLKSMCIGGNTIGLVGYPNVGKSSTINALCHANKVSVSATPGKTKHFQTLEFPDFKLCDCPGLIFPNFVCTKAEMICNGILPIDQLRDVIAPVTHVCLTISRERLEETYGMTIMRPSAEDPDQNRAPSAREVLNAYAAMRGFMTSAGMPDVSRGARVILKDYVRGKLLHVEHPPTGEVVASASQQLLAALQSADLRDRDGVTVKGAKTAKTYVNEVDEEFFADKTPQAMARGVKGLPASTGKKHFKGKKEKLRRLLGSA
eukprot:m.228647 g.228647  ORF g.228647 m.228647 type:complete len:651 (+) comp11767_c0_seq1:80-2032(+)